MEKAFNQKCHLEVYIHFPLLLEMQRNHSEEGQMWPSDKEKGWKDFQW